MQCAALAVCLAVLAGCATAPPAPPAVDFLPAHAIRGLRTRAGPEATVVAMYMNKRADKALAAGRIDDADAWARESVRQDAAFTAAQNTLGVVYLRRGQPQWAREVFAQVLRREPEHTMAMGNLVHALHALGHDDAAKLWADRLAVQEPFPPFHFLTAGLQALQAHDARSARALFRREPARQHSTTSDELALYAAQLDQLLAHRSPEGSAGTRRQ